MRLFLLGGTEQYLLHKLFEWVLEKDFKDGPRLGKDERKEQGRQNQASSSATGTETKGKAAKLVERKTLYSLPAGGGDCVLNVLEQEERTGTSWSEASGVVEASDFYYWGHTRDDDPEND